MSDSIRKVFKRDFEKNFKKFMSEQSRSNFKDVIQDLHEMLDMHEFELIINYCSQLKNVDKKVLVDCYPVSDDEKEDPNYEEVVID